MASIFISYSHTDRKTIDILVPQISNIYGAGSYWYDTGIPGGDDWWQRIQSEIQACTVFIFMMSNASVQSEYCVKELRKAIQHRKQILQVLLPELTVDYQSCLPDDLQNQLKIEQYVNLQKQFDPTWDGYKDLSRFWGALNNVMSNRRLPLSTTDRWLLHNQFEVLNILKANHPDYRENYFANAREILAQGYEWYYSDISQHIYGQVFPYSNGLEIINILDMFKSINYCYSKLNDRAGINKYSIEFFGFSGNNETVELQFTRFTMEEMKVFADLQPEGGLDSHVPMLPTYRKMLRAWNISSDKYNLTKEDILRIIDFQST